MGTNSQLIITGDLKQSDKLEDNGLKDLLEKKEKYDIDHDSNCGNINITHFDESDIQRSSIVNEILAIYNNYENVSDTSQSTKRKINNDSALIPIDHVNILNKYGVK